MIIILIQLQKQKKKKPYSYETDRCEKPKKKWKSPEGLKTQEEQNEGRSKQSVVSNKKKSISAI